MHKSEHAAGFEWQPEFGPEAEKPRMRPPARTAAPTTSRARRSAATAAVPCRRTTAPDPTRRARTRRCRSTPATRPPCISPTTAARPRPRIDTFTADDNGGICRREIGPEDTIDGIKAKDWAAYVGRSPMYYLMQFFRMSMTKQKVAVCLSAFLFGPAYLLYRKMWKEGLLTALLSIVLSVPSLIAIVATFNPSLFGGMPLHWVPVAADVCAIADWIVRILLGLFSVWLYRNTSKKNIDKIYSEYPEGRRPHRCPAAKGGTSIWAALLYFGIVLLLSSLVINLAGPGFVQYAMAMAGY